MAEGGSLPIHSNSPQLDPHLLECPICLEQLHQPKSLPCLHSFCHECLSTFISKDLSGKMASVTSFPCLVCRKMTQPVNPSKDKGEWAQQFPTHSLIQDMIETKTEEPLHCKPCEKKGNAGTPAKVWCKSCKVLFCESCKENLHDLLHEGCDTVDVSDSRGLKITPGVSSTFLCKTHTEKMDYYCEDHKVVGCSRCVMADHKRCEWTSTQDFCEQLKRNSRLDKLKKSLQKVSEDIDTLIHEFSEQLKTMTDDQDIALKSLTDLRQRVDTRLDALQKNITDELVAACKEEKDNAEMVTQKYERLMSSIRSTLEASEKAHLMNNNMETILLYHRGQLELDLLKKLSSETRETFTSLRLQHDIDASLVNFDHTSLLSMGKIVIKKEKGCLSSLFTKPLSDCCIKEVHTFNIKRPSDSKDCYARGIVYLPSDLIIVTDGHNKKLKLFTVERAFIDELVFAGIPYDVCLVDQTSVAITVQSGTSNAIHVVDVENFKLVFTYEINLSQWMSCRGITFTGKEFVVCTAKEFVKVTKEGRTDSMPGWGNDCFVLAYDANQECLYGSFLNSIVCRQQSDSTNMKKCTVQSVTEMFGIDVDRDGNVYVCGCSSNNVVQMSGDMKNARKLLTSSDGLKNPRAISLCGERFAVTTVSEENRNKVRVFQLY
ncbi:transcription intermediary factor 1-beta-like [Mizuhopecten yessoensis]|uniref:transcription intermediary factor 1-beta-like n=1 Tax=Mizuhopecten yessoensis TaxID=6573 RepID=UPI000B45AC0E|nr:transcription intermediary factor 1-beta-like [Mizuhopecten yessoensis]